MKIIKSTAFIFDKKYKWKVREIEFLGVVIEKKGIKMEEEKIKVVLD